MFLMQIQPRHHSAACLLKDMVCGRPLGGRVEKSLLSLLVRPRVHSQAVLVSVAFAANGAAVGFFSRVRSHMNNQILSLIRFTANRADRTVSKRAGGFPGAESRLVSRALHPFVGVLSVGAAWRRSGELFCRRAFRVVCAAATLPARFGGVFAFRRRLAAAEQPVVFVLNAGRYWDLLLLFIMGGLWIVFSPLGHMLP